ncbi:hypothetical protein HPB51_028301 [Rhipicephalus microplus]|uniref:Peptidase M13 C-terminal domain-containing protein n=1 Tax=Rhipicephalus microplus TaxID=6941 RepID=A0A9J6CXP8_RHIMP|nr:hypothetical protein HPB51_028301 [Rhipicephalus microplus]
MLYEAVPVYVSRHAEEKDQQHLLIDQQKKDGVGYIVLNKQLSVSTPKPKLSHLKDSENVADLVGTMLAYAAYSSLPQKYKDVKLAGFDMSPDRLFFVSDCTKWCTQSATARSPYAPMRSRCIVPLMNMPEFSSVFGCAAGAPMNPVKKCTFW